MMFMLLVFARTTYAEKSPLIINVPMYTKLVTDKKTGAKLFALNGKIEGDSGIVYEWSGGTRNGYVHGAGTVKEYRNKTLIQSTKGTFDQGKMQGSFTGKSYGKDPITFEGNCKDGHLKGNFLMSSANDKLELMADNNTFEVVSEFRKHADGTNEEVKFANGEPISVKMALAQGSYVGGFTKNGMNGKGLLKLSNGIIYDGEFLNNKMHGKGKLTYADGKVYIGDFKEGDCAGEGTLYDKNGKVVRQGKWEKKSVEPASTEE